MATENQTVQPQVAGDPTLPGLKNETPPENGSVENTSVSANDVSRAQATIAGKTEAELAAMSLADLERSFGLEIGDRSQELKEGDAPAHVLEARVESGDAVERTEATPAAPAAQVAKAAPAAPAAQVATAAPAAAAPGTETAPQFVESRDGKGRIPYSVLEGERAAHAREKAANAELQRKLDEALKGGGAAIAAATPTTVTTGERKQVAAATTAAAKGALTDEQLTALAANLPEDLVEALRTQNESIKKISEELAATRALAAIPVERERAATQKTVMDIIDADPVLSAWRLDADQTMWKQAVALDNQLASLPLYANKTTEERYAAVKAALGVTPVSADTSAAATAAAAQTAAALALQRATAAANGPGAIIPMTHSDMPGGAAPAQTENGRIEAMDAITLGSKFDKMSTADIERTLSTL